MATRRVGQGSPRCQSGGNATMVRRQRRARAERPKLYGEGSDGRERAPTVLLREGRFVGVTSTSGDGLHAHHSPPNARLRLLMVQPRQQLLLPMVA